MPRVAYYRNGIGVQLATCSSSPCTPPGNWTLSTVDSGVATTADGIGFSIDGSDQYSVVTRNITNSQLRLSLSQTSGGSFTTFPLFGATGLPSLATTATGGAAISVANGANVQSILFGK